MSVLRKKPYIETLLGGLTKDQLGAIRTACNTPANGEDGVYSFTSNGKNLPTLTEENPYQIENIQLELERNKVRNGIVVRTLTGGALTEAIIVYGESHKLTIYKIDSANKTYELVEEYCDIEELRRILADEYEGGEGSADYIRALQQILSIDGTKLEAGGNAEVDGNLKVNGAIQLESEAHLTDHDGYSLLPYAGYQGIDLTQRFADEISAYESSYGILAAWGWIKNRISTANFVGLNIKDYIPLTLGGHTYKMQIAGIDTYYKNGSPEIGHHIDFISHELWASNVQWNKVNNNNGLSIDGMPFMVSNVKRYLMAELGLVPNSTSDASTTTEVDYRTTGIWSYFPEQLKSLIVEKNILRVIRFNTDGSIRNSDNIDWSWGNLSKLWLPDEFEVYGHEVYETNKDGYGNFFRQYPLFEDGEERVKGRVGAAELDRQSWWLLAPPSGGTTLATSVGNAGFANYLSTSISVAVPVCFRIA